MRALLEKAYQALMAARPLPGNGESYFTALEELEAKLAEPTPKPMVYLQISKEYAAFSPNFELCDALGKLNVDLPEGRYPLYLDADAQEQPK